MISNLILAFASGVVVGAVCMGFPLYAAYKGAEVERKHLAAQLARMAADFRERQRGQAAFKTYTRSKQA